MSIPMIDMVRTGQNIKRLRKIAGVSVKDLQEVFGFNTSITSTDSPITSMMSLNDLYAIGASSKVCSFTDVV